MTWRDRMRKLLRRSAPPEPEPEAQKLAVQLTPQAEKVAISGEAAKLAARLERLKLEAGMIPRG